jgi:hypothetical protein
VAKACNPSYSEGRDREDSGRFEASLGKKQHPISEITNVRRIGGVTQAVEHLPSKCKALNST